MPTNKKSSGITSKRLTNFKREIWRYYRASGRHDLPWRKTRDPYAILVSEIMLQQTQVDRVIPFYQRFIAEFPNFDQLAQASVPQVLKAWQGLGYNRRALALKKISEIVVGRYQGKLPEKYEELLALPGIGPTTAAGVGAYAFNRGVPFIETNIRRTYIHFFFPRKEQVRDDLLLPLVEKTSDTRRAREWYWALMDYGTMLAKTVSNPNRRSAHYTRQSTFTGSTRQLRGQLVRLLLAHQKLSLAQLARLTAQPHARVEKVIHDLVQEGFIAKSQKKFMLGAQSS
jgi:A/G-specific adenine glycosylase